MQYSQFYCDPFTKLPFFMVPKWAVNWVLVAYDLRRFENKESYYAFRWTDSNRTICFWNKLNLSKNMKAKMILSPHSIRSKLDIKLSWALDIWSQFSIKKIRRVSCYWECCAKWRHSSRSFFSGSFFEMRSFQQQIMIGARNIKNAAHRSWNVHEIISGFLSLSTFYYFLVSFVLKHCLLYGTYVMSKSMQTLRSVPNNKQLCERISLWMFLKL